MHWSSPYKSRRQQCSSAAWTFKMRMHVEPDSFFFADLPAELTVFRPERRKRVCLSGLKVGERTMRIVGMSTIAAVVLLTTGAFCAAQTNGSGQNAGGAAGQIVGQPAPGTPRPQGQGGGGGGRMMAPIGVPMEGMPFVHDPSTVVRWKGRYWEFSTGRGAPFYSSPD